MDNAYREFDKWVKEGMELMDKDLSYHLYHFLYKLTKFMNGKNAVEKILLQHLQNIRKNIEKITKGYAVANINSLIEELKNNILMRNYFSIFYNVETLAERILDLIIKKENDLIEKEIQHEIIKYIDDGYFTLQKKIELLEEIMHKKHATKDMKILIKIIKLLQRIRNKFMFHIVNFDDYQFVFGDDMGKKEEFLQRKILEPIKSEIDNISDILEEGEFDERKLVETLIKFYQKYLERLYEFYSKERSNKDVEIVNIDIYEHFPQNFAEISYIFILFFGKSNLNLFN
ncbi:MAG: hypothetical protein DRN11_03565 [Thermoplasmata archaeon]|nr:MAG: hypothetical protein DRN11_03565 [Thermoplasmata archaeon]